jgi:hypothetical protein
MTENMPVREQVDNEQGIVSFFIQISHLNCTCQKKLTLTLVFWQGFVVQIGNCKWQKQPRLQGHWRALGEVQFGCILANRAKIKRILRRN